VPRQQLGTATAAGVMFRQVGGSLGVAVLGAIFTARMLAQFETAEIDGIFSESGEFVISPSMLASFSPEVQQMIGSVVVDAMHPIFWVAGSFCVLGLIAALFLQEVRLENRMVKPEAAKPE